MAAEPKTSLELQRTSTPLPTFLLQIFISLIFLDDLHGSLGVVEWEQNLV